MPATARTIPDHFQPGRSFSIPFPQVKIVVSPNQFALAFAIIFE